MSKYTIPSKIFLEMGGWRQPLLMVDKIADYKYGENGFVSVVKHVTYNEPYLLGHFPEDPIMPGGDYFGNLRPGQRVSLFPDRHLRYLARTF